VRILLVRPRPDPETIGLQHVMVCEPLELEYLAAAVADLGHDVKIVDMILERAGIEDVLRAEQPDVLGVTAYISHVDIAIACCRAARRLLPRCRTVVGGVQAEVVPEDFLDPAVDDIVWADPCDTFRDIVRTLAAGGDPSGVAGRWRPGAAQTRTHHARLRQPWPDRVRVARYRSRYYYLFHRPCALIKTALGCPHACTFCFCRVVTDGAYLPRDLDDVVGELAAISERDVYIVDDDFLVSAGRVREFCRRVRAAGLRKRFLVYGRADFIAAHEEVVAEFRAAGLRAVIVGLESHRAADLQAFRKGSDVAAAEQAVRVLARHGVDCYATLILGPDWETRDFADLGRWLRGLGLLFVNLQPFTPLPGTALFEAHRGALAVPQAAHAQWDLAHLVLAPTRMTPAAYYAEILKLYRQVAFRPAALARLLLRHGPAANLRLLAGALRVARQYARLAAGGAAP
jgi:hopanoid C-3 methylase